MNEKLKDQDVLLVKEKDDALKVVKGINSKEKKLETVNPSMENQPDFMKFDKHGNLLDNFLSNFMRQVKDPTHFMFFKAPADRAEETAKQLQEALKNPEATKNKTFLDMHKVELPPPQEHSINPDLINWEKLENYGISRQFLEFKGANDKMSNLDRLLNYQKTNLVPVTLKLENMSHPASARLSLRKQEDGSFSPVIHLIKHKPELERPYFGIKFTEEDKQNLLKTGNLGRIVEAEFKNGEKVPILISLDKLTNELVSFRKEWLKIPDTYKGAQLSEEEKLKLSNGEKVEIKGMISNQGNPLDGVAVQFNADKRLLELIFDKDRKQFQDQKQDGVNIPKKILGVALTQEQQDNLKSGKTVYIEGMKGKDEQNFDAYIKVNTEKNKLDFFKYNPDKSKKQDKEDTLNKKQSENQEETKKRGRKVS
jgi:hypothetical protein